MRLLNVSTQEVEEFFEPNIPPYAILSHTRGPEEVTLADLEAMSQNRQQANRDKPVHMVPSSMPQVTSVTPIADSLVTRTPDKSDAMRLMMLHTMLMAFRGQGSRYGGRDGRPALPALTSGYESTSMVPLQESQAVVVPKPPPPPPSTVAAPRQHAVEAKAGYAKISYACGQAKKEGLGYVWVDTCCIDQRSSAEVSEAINSSYSWYQRAAVCYAYLDDVHFDNYTSGYRTWEDEFGGARWFSRGWTLQELLAPRRVVFYAKDWRLLGTKSSLVKTVEKITGIDELTLLEPRLVHNASVAQRMSWAASRTTSRVEDAAYSLLGLFAVNMTILYGEGENAFLRLQEEIIKRSDDQTIFAWGALGHDTHHPHHHHPAHAHLHDQDDLDYESLSGTTGILARSPKDFAGMNRVVVSPPSPQTVSDHTMTNKGLHIKLPLVRVGTGHHLAHSQKHFFGILHCHVDSDPSSRLAILVAESAQPNVLLRAKTRTATHVTEKEVASAKTRLVYVPNAPSNLPRSKASEEIVFVKAPDLLAPGYEVVDVQSKEGSGGWNKEFSTLRMSGLNASGLRGSVLYQLAVVTFWNRGLKCGFVLRLLVDAGSGVCFLDLVQDLPKLSDGKEQPVKEDEERQRLVDVAKKAWKEPGRVEVKMPAQPGRPERRTLQVDVENPEAYEAEEGTTTEWKGAAAAANSAAQRGWMFRTGCEMAGVNGSVTFVEKWERDYQRTVNAKVARKKKGVISLEISSFLWMAAPATPVVQEGGGLDEPS